MTSVMAQQGRRVRQRPARTFSRAAFYVHLWGGVVTSLVLVAIGITGILLNHKRALGLMPDVPHVASGPFEVALPLDQLARAALDAAPAAVVEGRTAGDPVDVGLIDRMDVRPRDGLIKVRFRDRASTEVTVDLASGRVLHVGRRGDVFLEKLHSGEAFGGVWIILSDIAAVALILMVLTGYWLWLVPKLGRSARVAEVAG